MDQRIRCREMEATCREIAETGGDDAQFWYGEAERWAALLAELPAENRPAFQRRLERRP